MSTRRPPDRQPSADALDQWLALRAQRGDQEALRRLVERWNDRLHRHAMRLTGRALHEEEEAALSEVHDHDPRVLETILQTYRAEQRWLAVATTANLFCG